MNAHMVGTEERRRRRGSKKVMGDPLARFRDLVDGVNAVLWEVALPSWRFTFVSHQAEKILGYPVSRWLDEDGFWANIVHPDDRDWAVRFCADATAGGRDHEFEYRAVAADGRVVWLSDCIRVVKDEANRPVRLQGVMLDVTARHEAQERAQQLARETGLRRAAERALRLRDEILGVVAHDLRNPVHTIAMTAAAMAELSLSAEEHARHLRVIQRSAHTMDRLIGDLLDVHRKETGTFAIRRERVDVTSLIGEIVETFTPQAEERGIALALDDAEPVPAVEGDRDRLIQVLWNLVGNALKFTEPGGRVALRAAPVGSEVRVTVRDTGNGIAAADVPHVFDRFWQAKAASGGGAGLGLYIAKAIVDAHGGRIWVESVEGKGCSFTIALPAAARARQRAPAGRGRRRRA